MRRYIQGTLGWYPIKHGALSPLASAPQPVTGAGLGPLENSIWMIFALLGQSNTRYILSSALDIGSLLYKISTGTGNIAGASGVTGALGSEVAAQGLSHSCLHL